MTDLPAARTYLYVPGDRPDRFPKAAASGADAVILDLEDGVGPAGKDAAYREVAAHERSSRVQWWVRLDPGRLADGVDVAARAGTSGVLLPGAEPARMEELVRLLDASALPGLAIVALVETPLGVVTLRDLAAAPRVHRVGLGEADLAAELGLHLSSDKSELWPIRSEVVVASALAGVAAPVGPVHTDIEDLSGLRTSTRQLVRQGYAARTLVHPVQVAVVHEALAPDEDEIVRAHAVVAAFKDAERVGAGVARDPQGRLVDLAIVRVARAVLDRAR